MGWVGFTWNLLLSCSGGTSWGQRQDQEEVRKCKSCARCIACNPAPMPRFNAVNIFQVVKEKGQKQRLTFVLLGLQWLISHGFIWKFSNLQSWSPNPQLMIPLAVWDQQRQTHNTENWVLTMNLREIHVECEIFRLVIKQFLLRRVGIHVRKSQTPASRCSWGTSAVLNALA